MESLRSPAAEFDTLGYCDHDVCGARPLDADRNAGYVLDIEASGPSRSGRVDLNERSSTPTGTVGAPRIERAILPRQ